MATVDLKVLTAPVGIVRILELLLTCLTFSLAASVATNATAASTFWTWCMFTWCFCFTGTFLILLLEFICVHEKLRISWTDFTAAFAMLATLMELTASILYPIYWHVSGIQNGATVTSILAFSLYAVEVGLTRAKPGEVSGFLSTVPGLLKVLEAFVACIIFIFLDNINYHDYPGLQWCVAVYSICFIFALLVIVFTICRLLALFPAPFDKVLTGCNVLAVLMYMTAVVVWPLYSFQNNPSTGICCSRDHLVVITFMTCLNLVAYIVDTTYSVRLTFFLRNT